MSQEEGGQRSKLAARSTLRGTLDFMVVPDTAVSHCPLHGPHMVDCANNSCARLSNRLLLEKAMVQVPASTDFQLATHQLLSSALPHWPFMLVVAAWCCRHHHCWRRLTLPGLLSCLCTACKTGSAVLDRWKAVGWGNLCCTNGGVEQTWDKQTARPGRVRMWRVFTVGDMCA